MIDLYVYYKVRIEDVARLEPLVRALQARLAASAPSPASANMQLKCRPGSSDGVQTWMEVYPGVPDSFAAALEAAAASAGLEGLTVGPRRAEVFVELTACA